MTTNELKVDPIHDGFDGEPGGLVTSIQRQYFSVTYEITGDLGDRVPLSVDYLIDDSEVDTNLIANKDIDKNVTPDKRPFPDPFPDPVLKAPWISAKVVKGPFVPSYDIALFFDFKEEYSVVALWFEREVYRKTKRAEFVATDASGKVVDRFNMMDYPGGSWDVAIMGYDMDVKIKRVTMFLEVEDFGFTVKLEDVYMYP